MMTFLNTCKQIALTILLCPCGFCCLVGCCIHVALGGPVICGTGHIQKAQRRKRAKQIAEFQKERRKNEPPPLHRRRRALSSSPTGRRRPFNYDLISCHFLRLPIEVRQQIIADVLGNGILHLVQLPKRLGHIRCKNRKLTTSHRTSAIFHDLRRECFHPTNNPQYHYDEAMDALATSDGCLALLQACRQLYLESIDILYATNTFDVNHAQTLIFLSRTIRPQRLATVRSLQINWTGWATPYHYNSKDVTKWPDDRATWENMWDIVGTQLSGLRNLKLRLEYTIEIPDQWQLRLPGKAKELLEMMLEAPRDNLKGLKNFELEIVGGLWNVQELQEEMRRHVCSSDCCSPTLDLQPLRSGS